MDSSGKSRDYWRYASIAVISLLVAGNGFQYYRYQELEADHRALRHNAKQLAKTVGQLEAALKRRQAKAEDQQKQIAEPAAAPDRGGR